MRSFTTLLAIALTASASQGLAKPDPAQKRIFYAEDGVTSWELLTDDAQADLYYRLPEGFGVVTPPGVRHGVIPERKANGNLLLTFSWGPKRWFGDDASMRAAIRRASKHEPSIATLFPRLVRLEVDPELLETYGASLTQVGGAPTDLTPGSRWLAQLEVPATHEASFVKRVVQGAGFSGLVSLSFRASDPALGPGESPFPYAVSFYIGSLEFCEVKPELPCS